MYGRATPLKTFRQEEAVSFIRRVRSNMFRGNDLRAIESPQCRCVAEEGERDTLQFNIGYSLNDSYRRIVGFGHPDLIQQLRQPGVTIVINATYKITSPPFTHITVVMMYDRPHDYYAPFFYILVDNKDH